MKDNNLLKSWIDQNQKMNEKEILLYQEKDALLISIMKELKEVFFDLEDEELRMLIRSEWDTESNGSYHNIASIIYLPNGNIGIEDEEENIFFFENLDSTNKSLIVDTILLKLKREQSQEEKNKMNLFEKYGIKNGETYVAYFTSDYEYENDNESPSSLSEEDIWKKLSSKEFADTIKLMTEKEFFYQFNEGLISDLGYIRILTI